MPKSFLGILVEADGKQGKIKIRKAGKTLRKQLIFHMKTSLLGGHLKLPLAIAFALCLIIQVAHDTSCVVKHHLVISVLDPSHGPFGGHICSGCFDLEQQSSVN